MLKDLCFEIIEKCPNNCKFCSSNSCYDKDKIISFEKFKEVIDYFMSNGGIEELSLSGGEPFLHPDLLKMVAYAKSYGIRVVVFTSGVRKSIPLTVEEKKYYVNSLEDLLCDIDGFENDNEFLKKCVQNFYNRFINPGTFCSISKSDFVTLKSIGLDKVVFDFQAYEQEIDQYIMGRNSELHICFLDSLIHASLVGLEVDAHFIPMKPNYKEIGDVLELLDIAGVSNISILKFVPQGRGYTNCADLQLSDDELNEFFDILNKYKEIYSLNVRIGIPLSGEMGHKCTAGLEKLDIKFDGTVLPCPAFKELSMSDMNKYGIKYYNIYENLDEVIVPGGKRVVPLCKRIYK